MKRAATVLVLSASLASVACGGRVVVDHGGGGGDGGAPQVTSSSSSGAGGCEVKPADGHVVVTVCVPESPGVCDASSIAGVTNGLMQTCVNDPLCGCRFTFVTAPCGPDADCCYDVEAIENPVVCQ